MREDAQRLTVNLSVVRVSGMMWRMGDFLVFLFIIIVVVIMALIARTRNRNEDQFRTEIQEMTLDGAVREYMQRDYRIQFRTENSAQLVRPKKFSFEWALLWFLVFGVGLIVYLLYYAAKNDSTVYLEKTSEGILVTG